MQTKKALTAALVVSGLVGAVFFGLREARIQECRRAVISASTPNYGDGGAADAALAIVRARASEQVQECYASGLIESPNGR
jgi:hypothetical protein